MNIYIVTGEYAQSTLMAESEADVRNYMVEHGRTGYPWTFASIYFDTDPDVKDLDYCIHVVMENVNPAEPMIWPCIELSSYVE